MCLISELILNSPLPPSAHFNVCKYTYTLATRTQVHNDQPATEGKAFAQEAQDQRSLGSSYAHSRLHPLTVHVGDGVHQLAGDQPEPGRRGGHASAHFNICKYTYTLATRTQVHNYQPATEGEAFAHGLQ